MREIKFRAWDRVEREIIEWEELKTISVLLAYLENCEKTDARILMQYTGLKDKNGKEIYEGDIMKPIDGVMELNRLVEFVDGAFCYNLREARRSGGYIAIGKHRATLFEVIGNIYQHPELLQQ